MLLLSGEATELLASAPRKKTFGGRGSLGKVDGRSDQLREVDVDGADCRQETSSRRAGIHFRGL